MKNIRKNARKHVLIGQEDALRDRILEKHRKRLEVQLMKVKKITVEYDNGTKITFDEEELDALQKVRAVLELIDTGANLTSLLLQAAGKKPIPITGMTKKEPFSSGLPLR